MAIKDSRFQKPNENATRENRKHAKCTSQRNRKYAKCIFLQHQKPVTPVLKRNPDKRTKRRVERIQQLN